MKERVVFTALALLVAVVCSRVSGEEASAALGDDRPSKGGDVELEAVDEEDEDLEAFQQQMQTIFVTIATGVGSVLAVILGFYGWTFWTSIKCYFASKALKDLNSAANAVETGKTSAVQAQKKDNLTTSSSTSKEVGEDAPAKIVRGIRPIGPYRLKGEVVKGFGRGSTELGWPTANLDPASFQGKVEDSEEGVYLAWAQVIHKDGRISSVHKSMVSIGWNPAYGNTEKTVEAYICSEFKEDFYGAELRLLVVAYLRPQVKFTSKDWLSELKAAISGDVEFGRTALDKARWVSFSKSDLFHSI